MNGYLAYIRVSTVKQGEHGTSLDEQRSAIEAYAARHGLQITAWYEEMLTAAKQGRRQFAHMLSELQKRNAKGVIIHKIDRSARNLKDWAQLGDLIDAGVDVRFAHEGLDLASRGGRLAADIQAVVAADFIRNHRQVVKMGFNGRLKQGLYPLPAPRGYLNEGKGKPKTIDPIVGPLVREAFELYASGRYNLQMLRQEMWARGLWGSTGKPLCLDAISHMLHNPFYTGLIRVHGCLYEGVHQPLIRKALYDQVQVVLSRRVFARPLKHTFIFRRLIRCAACGLSLVGETRKGHTYYRCHTPACRGTSLREQDIERAIQERLALLAFDDAELADIRTIVDNLQAGTRAGATDQKAGIRAQLGKSDERLTRLTDAYLDASLDKEAFELRKAALLSERRTLQERLEAPEQEPVAKRVMEILGRGNAAYLSYESAFPDEKRDLVKEVTSDLRARGKYLEITMQNALGAVLEWRTVLYGAPSQDEPRKTASKKAGVSTKDVEQLIIQIEAQLPPPAELKKAA